MSHDLLARGNRDVLLQLAWSNVLLAFDYDGTLAPIVDDPARAHMRPRTRKLLERIAERYPTAVISGRAYHDAVLWLGGVDLVSVVGNHGLEPGRASPRYEREVARWRPRLEEAVAGLPGVTIEDKRFSLAVHYRHSRDKRRVVPAITQAIRELGTVRIVGGRDVVNVLPDGAPHKGVALERLQHNFGCDTVLFVGDDETDEDVFAMDRPGQWLGVRVGEDRDSMASYFIRDQGRIDDLLEILRQAPRRSEEHSA